MEEEGDRHSSLKQKIRSSICFSCCFRSGSGKEESQEQDERPRLIRASSSWLRSRVQDLPELKEKYRNAISRMGRSRRQSGDFRYDPLSYALNFDEGSEEFDADEFRFRNFSSRLPSSPPHPIVSQEISVIS
ncbi:uncharacterized protein LOC131254704 [Magnolia sinica]|uniref:uncharacterized protein LOC131254704 n=1 Tax=Magnolia sinica TaxID=86752 RepID=UPI0026592591|nr:uncharacterized protein LOC131254704 [Magnolia sinica]